MRRAVCPDVNVVAALVTVADADAERRRRSFPVEVCRPGRGATKSAPGTAENSLVSSSLVLGCNMNIMLGEKDRLQCEGRQSRGGGGGGGGKGTLGRVW